MPSDPEHRHAPHRRVGDTPVPPHDPSLPPLAVIALIEGALSRGLLADRDEAVGAALTAALTIAIETHGAGNEDAAVNRTEAIFRHLAGTYRAGIAEGCIRGRSRGGFERQTSRTDQQKQETST